MVFHNDFSSQSALKKHLFIRDNHRKLLHRRAINRLSCVCAVSPATGADKLRSCHCSALSPPTDVTQSISIRYSCCKLSENHCALCINTEQKRNEQNKYLIFFSSTLCSISKPLKLILYQIQ